MKLVYCLMCHDIFNVNLRYKKCHCGKTSAISVSWIHIALSGPGICLGLDNHVLDKQLINYQNTVEPNSPDRELKGWLIPFSAPHTIYVDRKDMRLVRKTARKFLRKLKKEERKKRNV